MANLGPDEVPDRRPVDVGGSSESLRIGVSRARGTVRRAVRHLARRTRRRAAPARRCAPGRHRRTLPATVSCQPLEPSLGVPPTAKLVLRSGTDDVTVRIQRYSSEPVRIGRLPPNTARRARTTRVCCGLTPWLVHAPGACIDYGATIQSAARERPASAARSLSSLLMNTTSAFGTVDIHLTGGTFKDVRLGTPRPTLLGLSLRVGHHHGAERQLFDHRRRNRSPTVARR